MPQRFSEGQLEEARETLETDKRKYWCYKCARPRARNYCPVTARTGDSVHRVTSRSRISLSQQVEFYLYQGGE